MVAAGVVYWLKYEAWVTLPAARALISAQLKDPDSTQFRSDWLTKAYWLCGELNAKNSMGGYVGFRRFISGGTNGVFYVEGQGRLGAEHHEEFLAVLRKETEIMKTFNELLTQNPDLKPLSPSERHEQAVQQRFDDRWKEVCEI